MELSIDLPAIIISSGIMTADELEKAYQAALGNEKRWRSKGLEELCKDPYFLSGASLSHATGAMLWTWDASQTSSFCDWANHVLSERFGLDAHVEADEGPVPERLWIRCGDAEELCNWRTINRARWMGAFCIMSTRLLSNLGVVALELETGGFDTVVAFAWAEYVEKLRLYLPITE
ncbi:MAG: hypothetical protein EXR50_06225 [Dehalococcoidia bacterium]|nr:hypothetical protein [Dehalococcoidia bacterium]